jgi:hypothetical protein
MTQTDYKYWSEETQERLPLTHVVMDHHIELHMIGTERRAHVSTSVQYF